MEQIKITEGVGAAEIAEWIEARLNETLAQTGDAIAISVPGGSTPFPIFESLVTRDLDWSRIEIWPGDDRIVPEDHAASNTGKIRTLFESVGAKVVLLHEATSPPRFSIVWLGMGTDGHIASLFPNTDPQVDDEQKIRRLTPDPLPPEAPFDRITLTIPALLNSEMLMFTLGGSAEKRSIFDAAVGGNSDLPIARLLSAADMPVRCFT